MAYIGSAVSKSTDIKRITFATTTTGSGPFALGWTPASENTLRVTVNGVVQQDSSISLSGSDLSLVGVSLVSGDELEVQGIVNVGAMDNIPMDGTVTESKIGGNAVTASKIASGAVGTSALAVNSVTLTELEDGTQGDVLYYGASGAPTRLGAGTSGQFLKTQGASANPVWGTVDAGFDSIALLSTQTASTSASVNFDNTLITSDYRTYEFKYMNVVGSADGVQLQMKFSDDNGSNFDSNHTGSFFTIYTGASGASYTYDGTMDSVSDSFQKLGTDQSWDAGDSMGGRVTVQNPSSTSFITTYQGESSYISHHSTIYQYTTYIAGLWDSLAAVNYVRFEMTSGNLVTGTFQLWGYK